MYFDCHPGGNNLTFSSANITLIPTAEGTQKLHESSPGRYSNGGSGSYTLELTVETPGYYIVKTQCGNNQYEGSFGVGTSFTMIKLSKG